MAQARVYAHRHCDGRTGFARDTAAAGGRCAKFTGEVGVCLATSGPGDVHLLNGLYDAKLDHQPVVAIVGQQALAAIGGSYQQEVALKTLFTDVARYSAFAELLGLDGILVQRPEEIAPAWEKALTASRPTLIEAITDPNGPPLPPHITFKNAKAYASALLKGDPDAAGIIKQSLKELVA